MHHLNHLSPPCPSSQTGLPILRSPAFSFCVFAAVFLAAISLAHAEVKLATLFRDGAVLQQGKPVAVWGKAEPGEEVKIRFKRQTKTARADKDGRWHTKLDPLTATDQPATLTATAKSGTVIIHNVVVGEVWLCSGQSNMNLPLTEAWNARDEIANATNTRIRYFEVVNNVSNAPAEIAGGEWTVCSPQKAGRFTGVGYFFARELQHELKVPIGIIKSTLGGSPIEGWMSQEALASDPAFAPVPQRWTRISAGIEKVKKENERQLAEWKERKAAATAAQQPFTEAPPVPRRSDSERNCPSGLYNGLIHPLEPFTLAGFLWYQGEGNAERADEYYRLFATMIRQWRRDFQQPDLPFLFVQLPLFTEARDATGVSWAWLRDAQSAALALPNTGMAVAIDVGEPNNIHPVNKQEVGRRLSLVALKKVYRRSVEDSGPVFSGARREGNALQVTLKHANGLHFVSGGAKAFEIAGSDKKFHPASARMEGERLVVSAPEVPEPVAVRFAWKNVPEGFLFNSAGLPAAPFRSDDWPPPISPKP